MPDKSRWRNRSPVVWLAIVLIAVPFSGAGAENRPVISRAFANCEKDKSCLLLKLIRTANRPYALSGSALVFTKLADGKITTREVQIIDYTIASDGVPATITFPSSKLGEPDKTFGLFFSGETLELVGPGCNPSCILKEKPWESEQKR